MKIIETDNYAAHYRSAIYMLMDKELGCDFCFGDYLDGNIKKLDYSLLTHKVQEVRNVKLGLGFSWQQGILSLLGKDYDRLIFIGEPRCLSTWAALIRGRFHRKKKTYVWTHGWYGKETWYERIIKKVFLRLPTGGVFLYGNYARELMIKEGFNPQRLFVIHNSLDYDRQLEIRQKLSVKPIYKNHFKNDYPNLFFVGRLTEVKRLNMILQAMSVLRDKGKFYNLTFIGDGVKTQELKQLSSELGLQKNVWFYGACYDEQVLGEMIYNADLCVAPGNIGLTAMHTLVFGTPAITHGDFPHQMPEFEAIREGETGSFFKIGSVESLADGISQWFGAQGYNRERIRQDCMKEIDSYWTPQYQIEILKKHL